MTPWTVPTRLLCPWNSPSKNTGVGCHALLQGIVPTQGSNPHFLHLLLCKWILYLLSYLGNPYLSVIMTSSHLPTLHIYLTPKILSPQYVSITSHDFIFFPSHMLRVHCSKSENTTKKNNFTLWRQPHYYFSNMLRYF